MRAVRTVLRPIQNFTESCVDDRGERSKGVPIHLSSVRRFLCVMRKSGMTLNLPKCEFGKREVKLVGHVVGSGHKKADPERQEGISQVKPPYTKKELRSEWGAFGTTRSSFLILRKLLNL